MSSVAYATGSESPPARFSRAWWRGLLRSRYLTGGGYALAVILTVAGVALASSPPRSDSIGTASTVILVVLGFNLVLILGVAIGVMTLLAIYTIASGLSGKVRDDVVSAAAVASSGRHATASRPKSRSADRDASRTTPTPTKSCAGSSCRPTMTPPWT